jgi:hypothetical protein
MQTTPQQPQAQPTVTRRSMLGLSARSQRLRGVLQRGFKATATCDATCNVQVRLVLTAKLAKRYGLGNGRADVVVARSTASTTAGQPARVVLRLSARARKALRHTSSLRLRLEASTLDAGSVARTVRLHG